LDGSGTAISLDDNDLMIGFGGDEAYLSGNAIFGLLEQQSFGFSAQEEEMLTNLAMSSPTHGWITAMNWKTMLPLGIASIFVPYLMNCRTHGKTAMTVRAR